MPLCFKTFRNKEILESKTVKLSKNRLVALIYSFLKGRTLWNCMLVTFLMKRVAKHSKKYSSSEFVRECLYEESNNEIESPA